MVGSSSLAYDFQQTAAGYTLMRQPEIDDVNLDELKPVNIQRHIGRRARSWPRATPTATSRCSSTPAVPARSLNLVIVHDDTKREYAYTTGPMMSSVQPPQSPWLFVSITGTSRRCFRLAPGSGGKVPPFYRR